MKTKQNKTLTILSGSRVVDIPVVVTTINYLLAPCVWGGKSIPSLHLVYSIWNQISHFFKNIIPCWVPLIAGLCYLTLDRKEERIEGREIPEFIFFFVHDNLQTVTILLKWPANTYPTSPGPSIYLPFEKFPESKYHTVIETICSWQNHASARAR